MAAQPSERRNRQLEDASDRSDPRLLASNPPSGDYAIDDTSRRGQRSVPGSASTLGIITPVSTGLESARNPGRSSLATVDSDAARVPEFHRGIPSGHVKDAHQEGTGSSTSTIARREELIPDYMRKTALVYQETETLEAFRNIFAHHKNADAKISDWVSYIPVDLHTQVQARIRSMVDPKTDTRRFTAAQVDNWQDMDVLMVLDVLIEPNAAALVDRNSLVAALENIELVPAEFF